MNLRLGLLLSCALLAACSPDAPPPSPATVAAVAPREFPSFDDEHLQAGRAVWMGTCKGCHDVGIAGAPLLGDAAAWAPRIAQGREVLVVHARDGHFGPKGTMMPARGGKDSLTDAEVAAAVDYMIAASRP